MTTAFGIVHVVAAAVVTVDAVLRKRHVSAVIGWIGLAWLAPGAGSILYLVFGVNSIQRSAVALGLRETGARPDADAPENRVAPAEPPSIGLDPGLRGLNRPSQRVTGNALSSGNRIEALENGDAAFPAAQPVPHTLRQSAQPPQDQGRRPGHRLHRRHEHPRRPLASAAAATSRALPSLHGARPRRRRHAEDVRHRLGLRQRRTTAGPDMVRACERVRTGACPRRPGRPGRRHRQPAARDARGTGGSGPGRPARSAPPARER